jgi:hypothetical protein
MKFIAALIVTALLSFAGSLFFPWWIIAVAAFIVSVFIHQKPLLAFITGFLAMFLLWGIQSFYIDYTNDHLLATKIANVLPLGGNYILLIFITALVGGLVGGMAALTGSFTRLSSNQSREIL